jgi:isoleucyl-tRNA synthetase
LLDEFVTELPALFIVSQVDLKRGAEEELQVSVERAGGDKCERCWKYTEDVGSNPEFPTVCAACAKILGESAEE